MTKQEILNEIQRTAAENSAKPLGIRTFERHTGIRYADWFGRYWKSWGDAIREAGLQPITLNPRMADDDVLGRYVTLARELRRVPVKGDLRLKRQEDPTFPNDKVFERWKSKSQLVSRAREFCIRCGNFEDVLPLFEASPAVRIKETPRSASAVEMGFVYLIKSGRYYKIGMTNSVGRREREFAIQLPEDPRTVHTIKTDDPRGIEAYWHNRFSEKRRRGEWFELDTEDVAAFKRRKFQ
jgi:hypothetical protein